MSIAIEKKDKKPKNPQLVCSNRERKKKTKKTLRGFATTKKTKKEPEKLTQLHLNPLKVTQLHNEKQLTNLYTMRPIIILKCHVISNTNKPLDFLSYSSIIIKI